MESERDRRGVEIAPSLLASDMGALGAEARRMELAGADMIHFDVMDGAFVPAITFGADVLKAVAKHTALPLDAHLMVRSPEAQIPQFADAGAWMITIHAEATRHLDRALRMIKDRGVLAGVALCPATPPECLEYVLDIVDLVLVMTVNPGLGGQKMIPAALGKVQRVRRMLDEIKSGARLQVDGGINARTAPQLIQNGADVLVAGSALFGASQPEAAIRQIRGR